MPNQPVKKPTSKTAVTDENPAHGSKAEAVRRALSNGIEAPEDVEAFVARYLGRKVTELMGPVEPPAAG